MLPLLLKNAHVHAAPHRALAQLPLHGRWLRQRRLGHQLHRRLQLDGCQPRSRDPVLPPPPAVAAQQEF